MVFFWTSKQPFAIHFFRAFCNVCLVAIPEIFVQTQRSDRSVATHSLFSTFLNHLLLWNKVLLNLWDVAYFVLQVRQIFCNTSFWHHYTTPSSFQCYKDCALSGAICSLKLPIFFYCDIHSQQTGVSFSLRAFHLKLENLNLSRERA